MSGRIEDLIDQALDLPARQRTAFVDRSCAGDRALRERLIRLLSAAQSENGFLDRPALRMEPLEEDLPAPTSDAGRRIGAFSLARRLGAGGMGEVGWPSAHKALYFVAAVYLLFARVAARPRGA
jgi:hypothetical protein